MDLQYLKSVLKYASSVILSVILIAYILYHMSGGFETDIETSSAVLTTKEETITLRATIMRDETLLYSPINGDINYLYNDGQKLPINTSVAEVYSASVSDELRQNIIAIDKKIHILESSNMSDAEKRTDTASTDKLIWKNLYSYLASAEEGRVSDAFNKSEEVLIQLNRRKIITRTVANYNEQIEALKAEKELLFSQLSVVGSTVVTDQAGYFYSAVDGYEAIFSSAGIESLTYDDYTEMCAKSAEDYADSGKGSPIGKLVTDYLWYAACEVSTDQLHNFETGIYYDVKFPYNGAITINMYLYRILSDIGSDTAILIFRTDILPSDFNYLRNQTVQVVQKSYTGYRVPVSAVHIVNGKEGVYILRGSKVVFRRIETLFEYDGYFLVKERDESVEDYADWLAKDEFIIVKGKNLYDGKIVN